MSDITITYVVLGAVVVLFVWGIVPVDLVAMGAALSLWATGVLELNQALGGFGDPTVAFIAALFVVSEGLDASGLTTWVGQELVRRTGTDARRLTLLTMIIVAGMSALITINGAVAALLPVVVVLAVRLAARRRRCCCRSPSGPMRAAADVVRIAGQRDRLRRRRHRRRAGVQLLLVRDRGPAARGRDDPDRALFGDRLLPVRIPASMPSDLSQHARTLLNDYLLDGRSRALSLRAGSTSSARPSPISGSTRIPAFRIARRAKRGAGVGAPLQAGDVLVLRGPDAEVTRLATAYDLEPEGDTTVDDVEPTLFRSDQGAAEVIVLPRSSLVGTVAYPGMVTDSGDLVVLAVQRYGRDLDYHATLAAGDMLLLEGTWARSIAISMTQVLTVHDPSVVRRQTAPLGPNARWTMLILGAMIVLLAFSLVPAAVAALLAAGALILTRVVSVEDATGSSRGRPSSWSGR